MILVQRNSTENEAISAAWDAAGLVFEKTLNQEVHRHLRAITAAMAAYEKFLPGAGGEEAIKNIAMNIALQNEESAAKALAVAREVYVAKCAAKAQEKAAKAAAKAAKAANI